MEQLVQRLKETDRHRGQIHKLLKRRYQDLKKRFRELKAEMRECRIELDQHEVKSHALNRQVEALEQNMNLQLSIPWVIPLPETSHGGDWARVIRKGRRVWKHPMRLGVLRQHEPKPLKRERFPGASPPGPESAWPSVSIVTPSYQQAAFLERTMKSVLEQDYPRIEYHVCDGGSNDGSVDIIRRYEAKLTGWSSGRDEGPASAINKGFCRSGGDIMAWLNSDDTLMPGAVRFVADYFARHPEVDAVYGHRVIIDERDWEVGRWVVPRHDGEMLLWADYVPQETLFWRRSLWERTGAALDETFKFAFDWDLLLRFERAGARIVRLPWFMGCFRVHNDQKSTIDLKTSGWDEMARLRARELGPQYDQRCLGYRVIRHQHRAIWCDRMLKIGLRW